MVRIEEAGGVVEELDVLVTMSEFVSLPVLSYAYPNRDERHPETRRREKKLREVGIVDRWQACTDAARDASSHRRVTPA